MPYSSIDELPDSVSDIPKHAKEIFLSAYNSAADSTCKDRGDQKEQCAMSIAWSAVKTKYKKNDDGKWVEKNEKSKSTIKSVITDRPIIDNGTWIPFLKPGQIAEGSDGKRYRITKEAIEKGYESYKDGFVNVNHQDHISGKISDVKYDGTFAYAKLDGLTPEALDVINSVAYRGVSQESFNLKAAPGTDEMTDVLELKGNGLAIALYPKKPGCPIESGCGIPIETASIVSELGSEHVNGDIIESKSISNFSLNTHEKIKQDIDIGGLKSTMTEYTPEQIKDMATFLQAHPDMIPVELKPKQEDITSPKETGTSTSRIASTNLNENSRIAELEEKLRHQMDASTYATTLAIQSALAEREAELQDKQKQEIEWNAAVQELYSCMNKKTADMLLSNKPSIEVLKSVVGVMKGSGAARVGVASGIELRSTAHIRERMTALQIPSIEFTRGGD